MEDYNCTIQLSVPTDVAFDVVANQVSEWWGQSDCSEIKGDTVFRVSWGAPWYQFRVTSFVKNKQMTWHCIDANQIIDGLVGIQKEWVGTSLHWTFEKIGNEQSVLHFRHEGLGPELVCFDFCSRTWSMFLKDRLVSFLRDYRDST